MYNFNSNASVRVIVKNNFPALHPMHLHGHNFFVLAEVRRSRMRSQMGSLQADAWMQQGTGTWDGKITGYPNTQRRDVQIVQPNGYLVIQYDTDNPGVWPFHCHIAWHVSGGLYVNLMEQPSKIGQRGAVPQVRPHHPHLQQCGLAESLTRFFCPRRSCRHAATGRLTPALTLSRKLTLAFDCWTSS